jgi:hypothetical protein
VGEEKERGKEGGRGCGRKRELKYFLLLSLLIYILYKYFIEN